MTRVLLVGLGSIARTHLAVLGRLPGVELVAAVDPAPAYAVDVPVVSGLDEGLAHEPDIVVLATPTATHAPLADELLAGTDAVVLSEKPLARSAAEIDLLAARHSPGVLERRLKVAHHFAFSPEVEWAARLVAAHPEWGPPTRVVAAWTDAYGAIGASQRASLVSSFVDSAPNQLSVVSAFAGGWEVVAHDDRGDRAVTTLRHAGGHTVLSSNWLAADSSKHTALEFLGGEVTVQVEHTSMTVLVTEGDRAAQHTAYVGGVGRKEAHYLGLYDALLHRPGDPRLGVALARGVAAAIEAALGLEADPGTGWHEVREVSAGG